MLTASCHDEEKRATQNRPCACLQLPGYRTTIQPHISIGLLRRGKHNSQKKVGLLKKLSGVGFGSDFHRFAASLKL
jgi:hypothetical protein